MTRFLRSIGLLLLVLLIHARPLASQAPDTTRRALLTQPEHPAWKERAPDLYQAAFETSKGTFVIEVQRDWTPNGADRFYNLVRHGYYDDARFHRVSSGYITQWGIHADPAINRIWKTRYIPDDVEKQSNTRGLIGFAMPSANLRSTQVYINKGDNSRNNGQGLAPFGQVIEGMSVVDSIYAGYGENSGGGIRQGRQGPLEEGGNAFMKKEYPLLDYIVRAWIRR